MALTELEEKALPLFEAALVDWSKPYDGRLYRGWITRLGLCNYFNMLWMDEVNTLKSAELEFYWKQYKDEKSYPGFDFKSYGRYPDGREERVRVLERVIHRLKSKRDGIELFECDECGEEMMHAVGYVQPNGQQNYECDGCARETSFP